MSKTCYKCSEVKNFKYFHKRKGSIDGHTNCCKDCRKLESVNYYKKHATKISEKSKVYRDKNKIEIAASDKLYYENNKEKISERRKIYWEVYKYTISDRRKQYSIINAEKISDYKKKYSKTPHGKAMLNAARRRRRSLKRQQLHPLNNKKIEKQLELSRQRLEDCLGIKHVLDHVWPLAKGGLHHIENLQIISSLINQRKKDSMDYTHPSIKTWKDLPDWLIKETIERLNSSTSSEESQSPSP